jgi:hypothetical protein
MLPQLFYSDSKGEINMDFKKIVPFTLPTIGISLLLFLFINYFPTYRWQDQLSFMILVFVITKFILQTTALWHIAKNTQRTTKIIVCSALMALCSIPSSIIGFIFSGWIGGTDSLLGIILIILVIMLICDSILAYLILNISGKKIGWVISANLLTVLVTWFYVFANDRINQPPRYHMPYMRPYPIAWSELIDPEQYQNLNTEQLRQEKAKLEIKLQRIQKRIPRLEYEARHSERMKEVENRIETINRMLKNK